MRDLLFAVLDRTEAGAGPAFRALVRSQAGRALFFAVSDRIEAGAGQARALPRLLLAAACPVSEYVSDTRLP